MPRLYSTYRLATVGHLLVPAHHVHRLGCMSLYPYLGTIQNMLTWLGRNSLSIVVFSPIFTVASKTWSDSFSFDPSAVSFLTITLVFVLSGCLCCAWLSDQLHLSHYLFGKKAFTAHWGWTRPHIKMKVRLDTVSGSDVPVCFSWYYSIDLPNAID